MNLSFNISEEGQSSASGWSPPLIMTGNSDHNHQSLISSMSNQYYHPVNQNLVLTQNLPDYSSPLGEVPSNYPIMDIDFYSTLETFGESMNNISNNDKNYITYNTPISIEPKGRFDNLHNFRDNTMWGDTMHKEPITSGYGSILDNLMVESSHPFDLPVHEGMKSTTTEISQVADREKKETVVATSKSLRKGNKNKEIWTPSEDEDLEKFVELYGTKKWALIANKLGKRKGKQCRERWRNHVRPGIKREAWSEEEDKILVEAHKVYGNKWATIALKLPGRCENTIKNRWNATKRRMHSMKTKQRDGNAKPPHFEILENYITQVTINNDPPKAIETADTTANTKGGDEHEDFIDGEMNLNLDVTTQTVEPLANAATTSGYVPEQEMFSLDYDISELFESMDGNQMFMPGWD